MPREPSTQKEKSARVAQQTEQRGNIHRRVHWIKSLFENRKSSFTEINYQLMLDFNDDMIISGLSDATRFKNLTLFSKFSQLINVEWKNITEVQQLRELRDNQLLQTASGTAFMGMFNDIYYSFSPIVADYERENPLFKEIVKIVITPMISSLSLMENAETESEVLGIGISVIMLNLGMYLGIPAVVVIGVRKRF